MNLDKIRIENFKSFGNSTTEIDLSFTGKKLLVGKNGTGKTSIFDALVWGIYGKTELKADNVVNKFTKENCKVEVFFEDSGKNYVVTRYRKHAVHGNSVYLFENGENVTPRTITDTQYLIEEIVGIDYRALVSSVVLSSETYKNFLRETNSVRLSIFDSVFSLKEIMDYGKITKNKIKVIKGKNTAIENDISSINGSISSLVDGLKSYNESHKNKIAKLENEILSLEAKLESNRKELEKISLIDVAEEKKKITENEKVLQKKEFLLERISEIGDLSDIFPTIKKIEAEEKTLKEQIAEYEKVDIEREKAVIERYEKLKDSVAKIKELLVVEKNKLANAETEKANGDKSLTKLNKEKNELEKKIKSSVENKNICPECGSIIDEEKYAELIKKDKALLEEVNEKIIDTKNIVASSEEKIAASNSVITKIESKIPDLEVPKYTFMYLGEVSSNLSKAKYKLENIESQKKTLLDEYRDKASKKEALEEELKLLPKVDSVFHSVDELDEIGAKIEGLKLNNKVIAVEIESNKKAIAGSIDKQYVKSVVDAINLKKEEKEKIDAELSKNNEDLKYFSALEEVFSNSDEGFKKYFIENSIDLFNENINLYLPFFFEDEINIVFDKNLSETIEFKGLPTEWNELSSGQKTRAELAVVFSLFMMVRALFGSGTNLLVLDEIIDQNLDLDGVNSVVNILNNLANDSAVFIVSHRDDYKERFDDILRVELDGNGFTKVS